MPDISENAAKAFPSAAVSNAEEYYSHISHWKNIYSGNPPWKTVEAYRGKEKRNRTRCLMGAAKMLCDNLSDLTFAEQCEITVDDVAGESFLLETLENNSFWQRLPELLSSAFALGGCVLRAYADNGRIMIDFVRADEFMPTEWQGSHITAGIFQTLIRRGDYYYTLLTEQKKGSVTNKLYRSSSPEFLGTECPVSEIYENLESDIKLTRSESPLFAYFSPAASNNILDNNVPLGISVFANAEDTLRELDIVFDSFGREFILGRKRIVVPATALRPSIDTETGLSTYYFDTDDEVFVGLDTEDCNNIKITDNSAELRVSEHITSINALLNILCAQTGLSSGSLSFEGGQAVKTATEVVSQESKTARTVRSNKNQLNETLEDLFNAVLELAISMGLLPPKNYKITIGWKDNVVIDDNTAIDNTVKLYSAGLLDLNSAVMQANKYDEKTAADVVEKIKSEKAIGSADFFGDSKQTEE